MNLSEWITSITAAKVSELLKVETNTVYYWRDLKFLPKPETMVDIVRLTHGLVTYESIIVPFVEHNKARDKYVAKN